MAGHILWYLDLAFAVHKNLMKIIIQISECNFLDNPQLSEEVMLWAWLDCTHPCEASTKPIWAGGWDMEGGRNTQQLPEPADTIQQLILYSFFPSLSSSLKAGHESSWSLLWETNPTHPLTPNLAITMQYFKYSERLGVVSCFQETPVLVINKQPAMERSAFIQPEKVSPLCNTLLKHQSAHKQVLCSNTLYTHRLPLTDKHLPAVATHHYVEPYFNSVIFYTSAW